jgi:hypothetical protein
MAKIPWKKIENRNTVAAMKKIAPQIFNRITG